MLPILSCSPSEQTSKSQNGLGSLDFPNTGSDEAQDEFMRGVMALHSYWYEEAEEAFHNAREIDPDFAMAYWGEAMSKNKTLWQIQDKEAALEILSNLGDDPQAWMSKTDDPKEKRYLESLGILYSEEDEKLSRDQAYSAYMKKFQQDFPEDHEVKAFYALSLLGILRNNQGNEKVRMETGALSQEILDENPDHPGALHYLIHAMDDPMHARLALNAAYRYSEVAPEAHHARHMPSHIFVQLGMWDRVVKSNISSWTASVNWADSKGFPVTKYDDHSLAWMSYGYAQKGQFDKALENLRIIQSNNADTNTRYSRSYETSMVTRLWVEASNTDSLQLDLSFGEPGGYSRLPWHFAKGWESVRKGNLQDFDVHKLALEELIQGFEEEEKTFDADLGRIYLSQLLGIKAFSEENIDGFHEHFGKGIEVEESLNPPTGPPDIIKPIHEQYGEFNLELGNTALAVDNFAIQLERTPNRSPSRLGMARALTILGDLEKAKENYEAFAKNYSESKEHPYFLEAKRFLIANPDSLMALRSVAYSYQKPELYYDKRLKITDCPTPGD